jgi:RNA methyltransferase, trmH family
VPESFDWGRISSQRQPQPLLGVFALPQEDEGSPIASGVSLLLDRIQDPGNLGTIIRTADWFGIEHLYLAPGTADPFAPKVVQATMGALTRVKIHRLSDTVTFLKGFSGPRLGTFLGGEDLYTTELPTGKDEPVLLIMGNEGQGIHPDLELHIDRRITIPPYPAENSHTESLNVAIATALLLGELRRRL